MKAASGTLIIAFNSCLIFGIKVNILSQKLFSRNLNFVREKVPTFHSSCSAKRVQTCYEHLLQKNSALSSSIVTMPLPLQAIPRAAVEWLARLAHHIPRIALPPAARKILKGLLWLVLVLSVGYNAYVYFAAAGAGPRTSTPGDFDNYMATMGAKRVDGGAWDMGDRKSVV